MALPPSLSLTPCFPGKVPSPRRLSVTELPGDEVRLTWAAAATSSVLAYQIKWTPLGDRKDGKAHEVWGSRAPPQTQPRGSHAPVQHLRDLPARPLACELGPGVRPPPQDGLGPFPPQISVPGNQGTAILPGLGRRSEHEITIMAYYRDGARSDPVSLRYAPRRWPSASWGSDSPGDPRHPHSTSPHR